MPSTATPFSDGSAMAEHADVRRLTERLASRLVDTLQDATGGQLGARHAALRSDRGRLELLMGRWMAEEITAINQDRLARGLSVGGDLEYTDEITLGRAFEGRQNV